MISDYLTVASILSGFGITVLAFRIQREIDVQKDWQSDSWMTFADALIIVATTVALIFVVLPLVLLDKPGPKVMLSARAFCSGAVILIAAYPWAILDHYGILPFAERKAPTKRAAPIEKIIVVAAFISAMLAFAYVIFFG